MEEQELLHQVSVDTNVNIELLKDLYRDEKFWSLIRAKKTMDAIQLIRQKSKVSAVGLREAQMIIQAFSKNLS